MKLAFIYPAFTQRGGAENYLITALRALASRGHDLTLFTAAYDPALYPALSDAAYRVELLGGRGFMEGLGGTRANVRALSTRLRGFDAAIAVSFPATLWTALGSHGVPVVWLCMEPKRNLYPQVMYAEAERFSVHGQRRAAGYSGGLRRLLLTDPHILLPYGVRAMLQRALDRTAVRRMSAVLAISPYIASKVTAIYNRADVPVVWSPVDPPIKPPSEPPEKLILVPTRLEPIKNVDVILRASAGTGRFRSADSDYEVIIVGEGSDAPRLMQIATSSTAAGRCTFLGAISDADRNDLYARCAFVVYPALAEPFGLPIAEAAAYAKPAIASHQGGPADLIADGITGILTDMTSPDKLATAIASLAADPARTAALGSAARDRLASLTSPPQWAARFESLLQDIVS